MMMEHKYFNIIKKMKGLNPLIFIMFFMTLQKVEGGMEKPTESNNNTNELGDSCSKQYYISLRFF